MPPRLRIRNLGPSDLTRISHEAFVVCRCSYATVAATTPAASVSQMTESTTPIKRYPSSQPQPHRAPEARRSQLLRGYVSLLNTTPLFLLFQHNNLRASEWVGVRRELNAALQRLDETLIAEGRPENAVGSSVKLEVVRTNILEPALRISDYYQPPPPSASINSTDLTAQSSSNIPNVSSDMADSPYTHALSREAYEAVLDKKNKHPLNPLLTGPVALLTFPAVSPQHIKAALQILAPQAPTFPAPTKRSNPGYWDPAVQSGVQKLMLLGARVEGRVFDLDETKWVGTIEGGIDGLRAQLVQMLQGFGAGITSALESASRNLYFTMEGRKTMLEEGEKPAEQDSKDQTAS